MEELLATAAESAGFTAVAFVMAIIALWRTLQTATKDRVSALEEAISECNIKHDACERRNRKLSAAVIDVINGHGNEALIKCRDIIESQDERELYGGHQR